MKPLALILSLGLLAGCQRHAVQPGSLGPRLEAAQAIMNVPDHDDALAKVSQDAANAGDGEITKRALGQIGSVPLKDDTAAACALTLARPGHTQAAAEIAR